MENVGLTNSVTSYISQNHALKTVNCYSSVSTNIFKNLILPFSIFDYSFFAISSVSESSQRMIQTVQNRDICCIYRLNWDSPTNDLSQINGLIPIKVRLTQLGIKLLQPQQSYLFSWTLFI